MKFSSPRRFQAAALFLLVGMAWLGVGTPSLQSVTGTPAYAATATVQVTQDLRFLPAVVSVNPGDTVTWQWDTAAGFHSVSADNGSFDSHPNCVNLLLVPVSCGGPTVTTTFSQTFTTPGVYVRYFCRAHGNPGGLGMSGVVAVSGPDTTAPAPVTGLTAVAGMGQIALSWTNPTDFDFAGVTIRQAIGATPPATPTSGTLAFSGNATNVVVTGLTNGTRYSFSVFARDVVPNYSAARSAGVIAGSGAVAVIDNAYNPSSITIAAGQSVTWDFVGSNPHSVTADNPSFDSHPQCGAGGPCGSSTSPDFVVSFPTAGTFRYHCRIHGGNGGVGMSGSVTVT